MRGLIEDAFEEFSFTGRIYSPNRTAPKIDTEGPESRSIVTGEPFLAIVIESCHLKRLVLLSELFVCHVVLG